MAKGYKTRAIVLKRNNFGEADKLITLFSFHYGKIQGIAKGIRKLTSRKGGNLELFNLTDVYLNKTKGLDIITEAESIKTFLHFKKDLKKLGIAFQVCELVDKFTAEDQESREVFWLLESCLSNLDNCNGQDLSCLLCDFKINLLNITGFGLPADKRQESIDNHIGKIIEKRLKFFYE